MITFDAGQLEALREAVDQGTFEGAARSLHVTPSAISQRIKALETVAGRVVVTRSKPVLPTAAGIALLRLARQVAALTGEAVHELGAAPGADVTVSLGVNADSLATWLLPALATVAPTVLYDVRCDNEQATGELLRQGTVMAAVSGRSAPIAGCSVEPLGAMRYLPVASPAFVSTWFAGGVTPGALAEAPVVTFDRHDELHRRFLRQRTRRHLDPPTHRIPSSTEFVRAVRLGLGWGMVPELQVSDPVHGHLLVRLDADSAVDVPLYWQQWRIPSQALASIAAAVRLSTRTALHRASSS
jgi:LysR family transcriptional regulator (chromosome initiation inhibitor)